jgi:hypothetical protein
MSKVKSPFLVYQEFLSPKACQEILDMVKVEKSTKNAEGYTTKVERFHNDAEDKIFAKFKPLVPEIEQHYGLKYKGTEHLVFQHFPEGMKGLPENPHCENSQYLRKKWVKVKERDLTGILWLKDYHNSVPLDPKIEVYGGKLEFPAYGFSLQPQRGTLMIYPAGPHFITATSPVLVGNSVCVRFHIAADTAQGQWFYQPENFPGKWTEWFQEYA